MESSLQTSSSIAFFMLKMSTFHTLMDNLCCHVHGYVHLESKDGLQCYNLDIFEIKRMPFIKISSEAHKAMKEYLVDIDSYTLGQLIEDALQYAMENLEDFEEHAGIEADEETEDEEAGSEEEEEEEDQEDKKGRLGNNY